MEVLTLGISPTVTHRGGGSVVGYGRRGIGRDAAWFAVILGDEAPVVVVSARVAATLAGPLVRLLRQERGLVDPEVRRVIEELELVGRAHRQAIEVRTRTSGPGFCGRDVTISDVSTVGTGEAADRLGVSERHVRRLIADGRLDAELVSGRWVLDPVDVDSYREANG